MVMVMASSSPHSCCLVSGRDPLGTTVDFGGNAGGHCGSGATFKHISRTCYNCQRPVQGSLVRGEGTEPPLHWGLVERTCSCVPGLAEDRGALSPLYENQMLSEKQDAIGNLGGTLTQAQQLPLMRCLCEGL